MSGEDLTPAKSGDTSGSGFNEPDWFLQILIGLATKFKLEIPITLNVEGLIITGLLIGGDTYFVEFAKEFGSGLQSSMKLDEVAPIVKSFADIAQVYEPLKSMDGSASVSEEYGYIHLKNARMLQGGGAIIPENKGVLWRGQLRSANGFFLGTLDKGS